MEIVLRVKQGNNANFMFLFPEHPLHRYFHYLVDQRRKAAAAAAAAAAPDTPAPASQAHALSLVSDAELVEGAEPSQRDATLMCRLAECVARHGAAFEAAVVERHGQGGTFGFVDETHRFHSLYAAQRRAARKQLAAEAAVSGGAGVESEPVAAEAVPRVVPSGPVGFALKGKAAAKKRKQAKASAATAALFVLSESDDEDERDANGKGKHEAVGAQQAAVEEEAGDALQEAVRELEADGMEDGEVDEEAEAEAAVAAQQEEEAARARAKAAAEVGAALCVLASELRMLLPSPGGV